MTDTNLKFKQLRDTLNKRHVERYDEIDILLTASLADFHVALIGAPGSGKSWLLEDICDAFGLSIFKTQVSQFTVPEELFGPLDVSGMKDGRYERITDLMLPEAEIAYIDEFFDANSSLQRSLLLAMNERKFKQGKHRLDIPLISLVASSNHFPVGDNLAAVWDRFHFRKRVDYIHEPGNWVRMMKGTEIYPLAELSRAELSTAQEEAKQVTVPEDVYERLLGIRGDLQLEGIIVSDRRFKQSVRALKAYAWLDGRDIVNDTDFTILQHMYWTQEAEIKTVTKVVLRHTNPMELAAEEIIDQVDEIAGQLASAIIELRATNADPGDALSKQAVEWYHKCKMAAKDLKKLREKAESEGRRIQKIEQAKDRLVRTTEEIARLLQIRMD